MATGQWQPLFAKILLTIIGVLCDIVLTFKTFAEVKIIKDKPVIIKPDSDPGNIHRERRRAEYQRQFVESKKAWLSKFSTPEKIESYLKSIRK